MQTNHQSKVYHSSSQEFFNGLSSEHKQLSSNKQESNPITALPSNVGQKIKKKKNKPDDKSEELQKQQLLIYRHEKFKNIISSSKQQTNLIKANNLDQNSQIQRIQKDIPFLIKPQGLIAFNTNIQTKVYPCRFKDQFLDEKLLSELILLRKIQPDFDHSVKNTINLTSHSFQTVFNTQFKKQFHLEQRAKKSVTYDQIPELKCKVINMDSTSGWVVPQFIENYLSTLRMFYQYKHYFISKALFCSQQTQKTNEKLKLMYFKLIDKNEIKDPITQKMIQALQIQKTTKQLIDEMQNKKHTVPPTSPETLMLKIIQKIKNPSFYKKNIAYKITRQCLKNNKNIITPMVAIELLKSLNQVFAKIEPKKRIDELIKIIFFTKPELILNVYPKQVEDKTYYSKNYPLFDNSKTIPNRGNNTQEQQGGQKQDQSSKKQNTQALGQQNKSPQVDSNKFHKSQESFASQKDNQTEFQNQKSKTNLSEGNQKQQDNEVVKKSAVNQQNTNQQGNKSQLKTKYQKKITMMTYIMDVLMKTNIQVQNHIKQLLLNVFRLNKNLITPKLLNQLVLYQMISKKKEETNKEQEKMIKIDHSWQNFVKDLFSIGGFPLSQQIIQFIENETLTEKSFELAQKAFLQLALASPKIQEYQSKFIIKQQPFKINQKQLLRLFITHQIHDIYFSKTQNDSLNSKLQKYVHDCKQKLQDERINNKANPNQENTENQTFFYIISEYHHGKTLRECIQSNWNGFQNHEIQLKLIQKLFYLQLLLEFQGFNLHIPTLDNVIINMDLEYPDLNINMTQFVGTIFLFTRSRQHSGSLGSQSTDKNPEFLVQKQTVRDVLPFVFEDNINEPSLPFKPQNKTYRINRIKQILSVSLFIICRRLDVFGSYEEICSKLKFLVKQIKDQKKPKQTGQSNKNVSEAEKKTTIAQQLNDYKQGNQYNEKTLQGQMEAALQLLMQFQKPKQTKEKSQNLKNFQKRHFFSLLSFVPQLYQTYLKKTELDPNRAKKYQEISYKNSNYYRIEEFEQHLAGNQAEKGYLFDIFTNQLAQKTLKYENITWRKLYQLFFMFNTEIDPEAQYDSMFDRKLEEIKNSKLLACLCQLCDYPITDQKIGDKLPPQLFFAIRYDINFCYFEQKFKAGWFTCFQIKNEQEKVEYDMEVICLLKNIKLQVMEKVCDMISELNINQSRKATESRPVPYAGEQNQMKVLKKIKSGVELLRYLRRYEKIVQIQVAQNKEESKSKCLDEGKNTSKSEKKEKQKVDQCEFVQVEYQSIINDEDLNNLERFLRSLDSQRSFKK